LVNGRSCGTCTKCCEGHLAAEIRGHSMYPGKPCFFVEIGKGCNDYENRPKDPCKTFECEWLKNPVMPDLMKPEISGVIVTWQKINDIKFLKMSKAPGEANADNLTWFIMYALKNKLNCAWDTNLKMYWIGTAEFTKAMNEEFL